MIKKATQQKLLKNKSVKCRWREEVRKKQDIERKAFKISYFLRAFFLETKSRLGWNAVLW